ncbi:MAG: ABC transporter permease [Candidatus Latescibacteria bacterium]|nr:ABC transporter permease [bacterium]MCB9513122.1 ABC transporter permease [Candidatus Latescibacterota bacterium]MCB9514587.1 ABC transporter permease [Candidatus Latescibacterota bacterium]
MTLLDALGIAGANLRRMKLRAGLTVAGVVIAIGAMVAMLSFGAGNHRLITERAESLGLLNTIQVTPSTPEDSLQSPPLDAAAVARFQRLPGVRLAYPLDALTLTVGFRGRSQTVEAQALPEAALSTKLFSQLRAGETLRGAPGEALVTERFLEEMGLAVNRPEDVIGDTLFVSLTVASVDSGLARVLGTVEGRFAALSRSLRPDSLGSPDYRRRVAADEFGEAAQRFLDGLLKGRVVADTLRIRGVLDVPRGRSARTRPLILRPADALRFASAGPPAEPLALFRALEAGSLFDVAAADSAQQYPQVTLDLDPFSPYESVRDSLRALGYHTFSFADQLGEIRRAFLIFDLGLLAIALVALVTAALGIVNTLLMSISERRREIGVLKALGADEREIRGLFLAESALMGALGAAGGILLGWGVARAASAVAKIVMARQDMPALELFATPLWLVAGAFGFGLALSLLAGTLPAGRAARVDPVEALRGD